MEKFTDWRDKGTGIAPFLPPTIKNVNSVLQAWYIFVLIVKLIFTSPFFIIYHFSNSNDVLELILRLFFDWKLDVTVPGVKRRDLDVAVQYPQKDQLYICNYSSPLDGYALTVVAQGPAVFLIPEGNSIYSMGLNQFVEFTLDGSLDVKKFGKECSSMESLKGNVVYMFAEGTCSNAKSVLPFELKTDVLQNFLESTPVKSPLKLKSVQLKINNSLVTPLPVQSKYNYMLRMYQKGIHMKCKIYNETVGSLDEARVLLNDSDKFKLVSKNLNIESKRKFVVEYKYRR